MSLRDDLLKKYSSSPAPKATTTITKNSTTTPSASGASSREALLSKYKVGEAANKAVSNPAAKLDYNAPKILDKIETPGVSNSTPQTVGSNFPSLTASLSKTLDRVFGAVRATTVALSTPIAVAANAINNKMVGEEYKKQNPTEIVSTKDILKTNAKTIKNLISGKESFSKGVEDAAQLYLKERKVGKYGNEDVSIGDVAVLTGLGFANMFGDPLLGTAALKALGKTGEEAVLWQKLTSVNKDMAPGLKNVKPTPFEIKLNSDLKIKVEPKTNSVTLTGYRKRFGADPETIAANPEIANITQAITKSTGMDAKVAMVGDDLVITGVPKSAIVNNAPKIAVENPSLLESQTPTIPVNQPQNPVLGDSALQKPIDLASKPIDNTVLANIEALTPQESAAFGRRVIENMSDNLGLNLSEAQGNQLPDATSFKNIESPDGRPAQINQQGKIEIFVPNLVKDLQVLAKGGKILEHEGPYSQVFKMNPGESMEELAVRYIREVAVHERAHQLTMTLADTTKIQQLRRAVVEATATKNQEAIIQAKTAQDKFMQELENKANQHAIENRAKLEKDVFPLTDNIKINRSPNAFERKALNIPKEEKITRGEKSLLKTKLQARSKGAREGYRAGSNEARAIEQSKAKSVIQTTKEEAKRTSELKSLKQRIIDRNRTNVGKEKIKSRYETLIDQINDKNLSRAEKRKGLIEYSEAFLPGKLRGKFTRSINGVRNDKDFVKIAERILKASDLNQRKVLVSKIAKELKGARVKLVNKLPNVKFEKEAQKTLDKIRVVVNGDYMAARNEMSEIVAKFQEANPNTVLPEEIVKELDILKMQGIKDMDAKELRFALDNIRSIKENGRTLKEIEHFNKMTERQANVEKFLDVITGGKPTKSATTVFPERELTETRRAQLSKNLKEFFVNRQIAWSDILDILSVKDKTSKAGESFISKYGEKLINDGFNNKYKNELNAISRVNQLAHEAFGLKDDADIQKIFNEMSKEVDLGKIKTTDGLTQDLKMTKLEAVQFYMWFQRERLQPTFELEFGWGPEVKDLITNLLSDKEKAYAESLLKFYKEHRPTVNEVYSRQFGYDLADESGYSPAVRDIDKFIPESVLIAKDNIVHASAKGSAIKKATKNTVPLKRISANENVMRYISSMEQYKSFDEALIELKYIFGQREVRQAITDVHGKDFLNLIDNYLDDFARGGVHQEKIVKFIDKLRVRTTRALIGLKPSIAVKQLSGILNYGIEVGEVDFAKGIASFWRNPIKKATFLYENSPAMQERFGSGFERDIKMALAEGGSNQEISTAGKLSDKAFVFTRAADKFTVMQGEWAAFRAKYKELSGKKFSFDDYDKDIMKQAIDYSAGLTNRVQESSRLDTQSALQRGGSYARALTMLAGQPNKYFRILLGLFRNVKAGRISKGTFIRRLLWTWLIVPGAYQLTSAVLNKYDTPEEKKKKAIASTILGPFGTPLIVGNLFQWGIDKVMGDNFKYSPTAITSFVDDFGRAVDSFGSSKDIAAWTYLIDSAAKFSGIPGTTFITKPIRDSQKKKKGGGGGKIIFK